MTVFYDTLYFVFCKNEDDDKWICERSVVGEDRAKERVKELTEDHYIEPYDYWDEAMYREKGNEPDEYYY